MAVLEIAGLISLSLIRAETAKIACTVREKVSPRIMHRFTSVQKHVRDTVLYFPKIWSDRWLLILFFVDILAHRHIFRGHENHGGRGKPIIL